MPSVRKRGATGTLIGLVLIAATACGGGGDGGGSGRGGEAGGSSGRPTTTADARTPTTTGPDDERPERGAATGRLDGTSWVIDANETLAANLSNLGGLPAGLSCRGPLTLAFAAGRFSFGGEFTCSFADAPVESRGSVRAEGSYRVTATELTVGDATSTATISAAGQEFPFDGSMPYRAGTTYRRRGDTLEITFTDPNIGTVTHTYRRVG